MFPCISVENMRLSDAYTIANFVPSLELMYRAATGVFLSHHWQGSTAIVVGSGNNGGDGFALARILKEKDFDCTVFTVSQRLSDDSAYYASKAKESGVPVVPFKKDCLDGFSNVGRLPCLALVFLAPYRKITAMPFRLSTIPAHSSSVWTSTAA